MWLNDTNIKYTNGLIGQLIDDFLYECDFVCVKDFVKNKKWDYEPLI